MKALIIVDVQNDFVPGGALAVPGGDQVIPIINALQPEFGLVVATQDWHPASHGSFAVNHSGKQPGDQIDLHGLPQMLWPVHCVQSTLGPELVASLNRSHIARIFPKGTDPKIDSYSGFFDNGRRKSTGLGEYLKSRGVTDVYIAGLATDYCVKSTALDAVQSGFTTHLVEDACRGVNLNPGDSAAAIEEMKAAGVQMHHSSDLIPKHGNPDDQQVLFQGKFVRVVHRRGWEFVERSIAAGVVVILPITDSGEVVLVEQYRASVNAKVIELPAGLVGDAETRSNEAVEEAARRELLEETGFEAGHVEILFTGPPSAGLTSEMITFIRATRLRKQGQGGGVEGEKITPHIVPMDQIVDWLSARQKKGDLVDPKLYAALFWAPIER